MCLQVEVVQTFQCPKQDLFFFVNVNSGSGIDLTKCSIIVSSQNTTLTPIVEEFVVNSSSQFSVQLFTLAGTDASNAIFSFTVIQKN